MEKLQRYFLSLTIAMMLISCKSKEEKNEDAFNFGQKVFHQGTTGSMNAFAYAFELDSTYAEAARELSIPYLKRGIPHEWEKWIDKAVRYDSVAWQAYRGYNYLWFYRDYKKAIADFNASDTLTPHIDHPQGHSVDFWRGIAYLGLKDYENSIAYWNKHITKETEDTGEDWVELEAFLYRGIAYYESGDHENALKDFDKAISYFKQTADAKYYKAKIFLEQEQSEKALPIIEAAIIDLKEGFYNQRPYVETLRQIYLSDLEELKSQIKG
ncbi:tetratricopeptide repeat protein [Croceitalea marina]|uniref:Tetratricopeptide repeat protein n=1 Tax=Croceitalea marina TaxID=1775166 RepID=A0ABW5MV95_9FLAO